MRSQKKKPKQTNEVIQVRCAEVNQGIIGNTDEAKGTKPKELICSVLSSQRSRLDRQSLVTTCEHTDMCGRALYVTVPLCLQATDKSSFSHHFGLYNNSINS